jgi:propionate CoA-transferase
MELHQPVLYVTERCVFRLGEYGVELVEVAPGIDIERDILALMDFTPAMSAAPKLMDARIFRDEPMGLRSSLLDLGIEDRITYDPHRNILFVNFAGLAVRTRKDVANLFQALEARCESIGRKVRAIVNYDAFHLADGLERYYAGFVYLIESRYYENVSRYATSAFMRIKLGKTLARTVSPHVFESQADASRFLEEADWRPTASAADEGLP